MTVAPSRHTTSSLGQSDGFGRRKLFMGRVLLFTAASVLAALAWNPAAFIAGRALQGLGAAAVVPTGMSLLTTMFAEGPQRNRALGVSGSVLSLGFTTGMLVGGAITVTAGLVCLIYALSAGGAVRVAVTLTGVLSLAAFAILESRAEQPLMSPAMLRRPGIAFGALGGLATFSMMSAFIFLLTLYLQDVVALSPLRTGLFFGVQGVVLAVTGMASPRVIRLLGARWTLVAGLAVQGICTGAMTMTEGAWPALAVVCLASLGHMSAVVSYGVTVTSGLPDHEQGLASGLATSAQQIGITVGIPILSTICVARAGAGRAAGQSAGSALLSGIRLGAAVDAALVLAVSLLIGYALLRATRRRSRNGA